MKKSSKVLVTVVAIVVFVLLFSVVVGVRTDAGHSTPGILGVILLFGLIGALKAVWKKDGEQDNNDNEIKKR